MRRKTVTVNVGIVNIGSNHSIKTQSMTTASTLDTNASVEEAIRIIDAGGELVRFTAPNTKEAENLENIKSAIRKKGYDTPFIADIHFVPKAALTAAKIVEKVRINPGNYVDTKRFKIIEYDDATYNKEVKRIEEKFVPLIDVCKENNTAMRIGTNHGSLSDRIMNRFGDTPLGMVESALEFLRICNKNDFDQVVLSMKSSNPLIMIHAYRLLVHKMELEDMNFPLHLGVTEAGDGIDGRIKSALGIGTLLSEGIGDTIRVSLTEDPEFEIPVADKILKKIDSLDSKYPIDYDDPRSVSYLKRSTNGCANIGANNVPVVISTSGEAFEDCLPDYVYIEQIANIQSGQKYILPYDLWVDTKQSNLFPFFDSLQSYRKANTLSDELNFIQLDMRRLTNTIVSSMPSNVIFVLNIDGYNSYDIKKSFNFFEKHNILNPVILKGAYDSKDFEEIVVESSIDFGSLLLEGYGNGLWIESESYSDKINELSFSILQNTRTRIFKTDYISCPSCGRTKFNLQETTALVKKHTSHLKGLKISVMGCIVNGPGEMADADYGYVGSGIGLISLYKGQNVVKKNIISENAVDELITLIKDNNDWIEPKI
ncbi:MAG: (E)-4-hydroxy-3-methylbut-2-enyl-diphosphate synthase [Candidatus Marinimicrobia bacterium]|jgi:(E)-4-hydroxy-3-methylbut-2-enyl-diphosphate synthase|nr:(E)-4-hydroxy-3-methylbut-2-enyl-diphosphate synthase [Gammaproteobacteria bacterium]MBL6911477.1 (E)-4-hydroxy-3-methylbut-2-enyl-diphosphate synthase [Candidatus Neomarinimicrobiota bacterium]MBT4111728.1 (E)-4-hydroxy-3-methylbut-2-enyl-diphosphate synthase [Candidatus Neomarinimicrobiota bacterium]MBT4706926.1 (E)-4-hydroxy-3-methylbut-2-enyl-diphosphate synthase [Candidatus Neomarinimicrobiota bacterium]MBT4926532.1 (E)-4-hydroxy-3-methylbut-2-enyl-diphosphate synthase [Candidatus Neoma